jgi:hypothetical protein
VAMLWDSRREHYLQTSGIADFKADRRVGYRYQERRRLPCSR